MNIKNQILNLIQEKIASPSFLRRVGMAALVCFFTFSCDFLDVVPDNTPTMDHAFRTRTEAQSYLYGLLGGMPEVGNPLADLALLGSDELYTLENTYTGLQLTLGRILRGEQGPVNPWANYWTSQQSSWDARGGKATWTTISDCNVFLENIHLPYDLLDEERDQWKCEALFVKAYLHFWLFRQYGPIPLIRENLSINTSAGDIRLYREPVDEVVEHIVTMLDEAMVLMPLINVNDMEDLGRPNKCIAAALKAQVLILAASPLFNCNPDYADYIDKRGVQLFPQDPSAEKTKWKKAADATKEAIDLAHEGLHRLYDAHTDLQYAGSLSEETILAMQVRGAVTERWNSEVIWGNSRRNNLNTLQRFCLPFFNTGQMGGGAGCPVWSPTLKIVQQFYTKNGLPIEDDEEWENKNLWALRTATADDRHYIRQGQETIELHFDREARFYASIFFDKGVYWGSNWLTADNTSNMNTLPMYDASKEGVNRYYGTGSGRTSMTGYLCKKLLNYLVAPTADNNSVTFYSYAFPVIRLADLYLLYAEALNEWKDVPDAEVYEYIDLVRARTGLKGVVESWRDHAVAAKKNLPATKDGMRDIIRRERLNELAFEGARYWDIRRWKTAESIIHNHPISGLNYIDPDAEDLYVETTFFTPTFEKKDYFSPIRTEVLTINTNLLQSPFWSLTQ